MWYGIGILYDRYGSFDHAEEAFTAVLKMDNKFEKANEIYFRLGIIYKQQMKHEQSLDVRFCYFYVYLVNLLTVVVVFQIHPSKASTSTCTS